MDKYQITFQAWNKVADRYQSFFMDLDLYNDTYEAFCNLIEKQRAGILEIGCGPGNISKHLLSQRPDLELLGIDIAPNMVKLARENNPKGRIEVMDCREIDSLNTKFEGIICGFCLPYLSQEDCRKLFTDCYTLLRENGIFYVSAIEGNYADSGFEFGSNQVDKMYVYYHETDFLIALLAENNFELVELFRKEYPKSDGVSATHLILLARKKQVQ